MRGFFGDGADAKAGTSLSKLSKIKWNGSSRISQAYGPLLKVSVFAYPDRIGNYALLFTVPQTIILSSGMNLHVSVIQYYSIFRSFM